MQSLYTWSDLPPEPPYMGQTGVIKIVDLVLLPYISNINVSPDESRDT